MGVLSKTQVRTGLSTVGNHHIRQYLSIGGYIDGHHPTLIINQLPIIRRIRYIQGRIVEESDATGGCIRVQGYPLEYIVLHKDVSGGFLTGIYVQN